MKSLLIFVPVPVFCLVLCTASRAHADDPNSSNLLRSQPAVEPIAPPPSHPVPRLKLSLVRFQTGNPAGGTIGLQALHLDMYALSWRYLRAGVDVEGGVGHTTIAGAGTALKYGLLGANGGFQLPGRITPFVEGRLAGGVLGGTIEDTVDIPGTAVSATGLSAATYMWAGGVNAGAEIYTLGRAYLSLSVGWIRSGYRGAEFNNATGVSFKDVKQDSFLFKVGFGI